MKSVNDVRNEFLNFFKGKGHTIVDSSPLVPQNDPTLMFTNSGMVQFKNVFTGTEKRPYTRATTAQKCVRAGGKHNDLENVGYTARHHTFFEMLGNFSFGDYFKEEAISYAWEFVSKNLALPKDRMLVTVHSSDEDAANLWKKIAGFGDDKIIRIPTNANFWMMGDTGPCGPCSEIFYDQGDKVAGGPPGSPDEDGDRYLEFWNNVFMQFEQEPDGKGGYNRKPLPKPSIDTGMGLERISAILQGKVSNYDIDLLRSLIEQSADLTGIHPDGSQAASHRVIADHVRCSAFLIADGVLPANDGRGYVLRRIMRRGMRHAHLLGAADPLLHRLVPTLVAMMGEAYPELRRAQALITETLRLEEERFRRTLTRGLAILEEETKSLKSGQALSGDVAFKLYDTFGFPLDLTQDALKSLNIAVDVARFDACMADQKQKARAAWAGSGEAATDKLWFEILEKVGPTEFLGYKQESAEGIVLAIIKQGQSAQNLKTGETGFILTNQTPFYAESGGQVGDTGVMLTPDAQIAVNDTKKILGALHAHSVTVNKGNIAVQDGVELRVDAARRGAIRANHSATHLLHEALRRTLGDHVSQKGSLQDETRTRFDIAHNKSMTMEELSKIEEQVNAEIRLNTPVETRVMPLDDARASGAMALFGEKYSDEVRVVSMGSHAAGANKPFSVELCGGTHVRATGEIGLFKIISESAVSAGIRRVEAITGANALAYLNAQDSLVHQAQSLLNATGDNFLPRLENLVNEKKRLEKEISDLRRKIATGSSDSSTAHTVKEIGGVKFFGQVLADLPAKDLKPLADEWKRKLGSGVIALVSTEGDKASLVVAVTEDLTGRISAVDLVRVGAEVLGGKGGGGRPDMAQAGGPNFAAANDACAAIENALGRSA
ncbi:MAG: alanine--tRNA ligase [Alphaproteobacteria bacterium]|nr:alanine--tRNA ligase [Alphaproteobacteria bacterium]